MSTELNKKLLDAIDLNFSWMAANACEKVCLQEKIDLLNKIMDSSNSKTVYDLYTELQEQLNQLK